MNRTSRHDSGWALTALALFFPLTAILHHRVLYPPTCILNPFESSDYNWPAIVTWVTSDPSPAIAAVLAAGIYGVGRFVERLRRPVLAFTMAFMPLALWIWDIPGSGRFICHHLHDGRAGLHTRHFFLLGAFAWPCVMALLNRRNKVVLPAPAASV